MNGPTHLAVDQGGSNLVVDVNNVRVMLLSASLEDVKELVPRRDVTERWLPLTQCLDERDDLLYVIEVEYDGETLLAG